MKFILPDFNALNILVVGDVMLDKYWHGDAARISPEAPVPIVHIQQDEKKPGGAGNVALNLNALGVNVSLLAMIGNDANGKTLSALLADTDIHCYLQKIEGLPTVTKLRIIGRHQQLIRLDFEIGFNAVDKNELLREFRKQLQNANAIILSDYGKGVLTHPKELITLARGENIPVLVDPKSQDFSIYQGASLITPNLREFEAIVGYCRNDTEIAEKGFRLIERYNINALLITRGAQGMTLLERQKTPFYLSAHAQEVYDVTGAGDTVIAVMASAMAAGIDLADCAYLANAAAGIVVKKLGAATVSVAELRRTLQRRQDSELGVLTEEELLIAVQDAKAHGESIVMTNGCFDILHLGHIEFLEEAKSLGKRLIVAVNDDASVKRLKGAKRPINTLRDRMAVLAALRAVDWVASFSENTPERLISRILPDVLVKGGDWKLDQIAGAQQVLAHGGIVKSLKFVGGYSTSKILERIEE